ncbi:MAG TPA: ABC transporter ATP-binding protein [Rhodospirillaceae bacterium]|nr:ABC transporter ATP-binding protein [Rhodospirillaceae bacterium]
MQVKNTPKIELRDVAKSFGSKRVLQGIDLSITKGESLVVIGGSGTGKSVLIKSIMGILKPEKGSILIDGEETRHLRGHARDLHMAKFGMLFQGAALFDSLPVWQNVAFKLLRALHVPPKTAKEKAIETLASVGLGEEVGEIYPAELSGGMQKRVGLARAIIAEPEIIFFDEPTTGLDPIMSDVINDLIVKCVRDRGITALSITHDMASARKISDKIAMLHDGKIIWTGPTSQIDHSGNAHVDQFINGRAEGPIKMQIRRD